MKAEGSTRILFPLVFTVMIFVFAVQAFADTNALLREAIEHYKSDDYEASKSTLTEVLKADPENQIALYYMGVVHYMQGNAKDAIPYLEKVSQSPTPIEGVESFLAQVYLYVGEADKALAWFSKEYEANPEDEMVAYNYASCLKGVGREDEAEEIFRRLIESGGAQAGASRYQMGGMLTERGSYVSATKLFSAIDSNSPYAEAAGSYIKSLAPFTKLLNFYCSTEYFYDDNPSSTSADRLGQQTVADGSYGTTWLGMLNTRNLEITDRLKAKMGYLYYGTFYEETAARDNDFVGHYLNPSLSYRAGSSTDLTLEQNTRFYYLNHQKYSTNLGGELTAKWTSKNGQSLNAHVAYMDKSYASSFTFAGYTSSLEYRDADTYSAGLGAVLSNKEGSSLTLDYTFNDERPVNENDTVLGPKALDSRFRENAMRADIVLPLKGCLSRLTILGNIDYSHKDYLNTQSGQVYYSAAGRNINVNLLTYGIEAQVSLWKAAGLNLTVGMEQTRSRSIANELDYTRNRHFAQLSATVRF